MNFIGIIKKLADVKNILRQYFSREHCDIISIFLKYFNKINIC